MISKFLINAQAFWSCHFGRFYCGVEPRWLIFQMHGKSLVRSYQQSTIHFHTEYKGRNAINYLLQRIFAQCFCSPRYLIPQFPLNCQLTPLGTTIRTVLTFVNYFTIWLCHKYIFSLRNCHSLHKLSLDLKSEIRKYLIQ